MKIKILFLLVVTILNVTGATIESGLSVTALHNHFFFDHPRLFFMHIEGEGTVEHLASSVRLLYDKVREFRTAHPTPADSFLKPALPDISTIIADPLNKIFRSSGEVSKGMIKFTFGRPAKQHGVAIDSTIGVNIWIAFAGNDENTVVHGDFAVTENDLRPALKSWGRGPAQSLAQSIQKALPATVGTPANLMPVLGKNVGFCYKISWFPVTTSPKES